MPFSMTLNDVKGHAHIGNVLKMCSQRIYLLKLLRDQGLPRHHLSTVFDALVLSRIRYAIPAWSGFLSAELKSQVNSFLKRAFKYGFCSSLYTIDAIAENAAIDLFCKMTKKTIIALILYYPLLNLVHTTSDPNVTHELPRSVSEVYKKSFVPRCLFRYM